MTKLLLATSVVVAIGLAPDGASAQPRPGPFREAPSLTLEAELDAIGHLSDVSAALHATAGALLGVTAMTALLGFTVSSTWSLVAGVVGMLSLAFGISASAVSGHAEGRLLRFDRRHPGYRGRERIALDHASRHARNTLIATFVCVGLGAVSLATGLAIGDTPIGNTLAIGSSAFLGTALVVGLATVVLHVDASSSVAVVPMADGALVSVGSAF